MWRMELGESRTSETDRRGRVVMAVVLMEMSTWVTTITLALRFFDA